MKQIGETTLKYIIRKTGRKPSSCKCKKCQQQCRTPCLGTPEDIIKLIDAGYEDRLSLTEWWAGVIMGLCDAPLQMIQATIEENGYCTFFNNGLCELHDKGLKPTEGKLSHHSLSIDNFNPKKSISWLVAQEWINAPEELLVEICQKLSKCLYNKP